jgi:hypothetical protein
VCLLLPKCQVTCRADIRLAITVPSKAGCALQVEAGGDVDSGGGGGSGWAKARRVATAQVRQALMTTSFPAAGCALAAPPRQQQWGPAARSNLLSWFARQTSRLVMFKLQLFPI